MDSSACVGALVETRFSKSHKVIFGKSLFLGSIIYFGALK